MTTILVIFVLTRQGNIIYALNKLLTGKYHLHKNICIEHQNIYKNKHILALYVYDNSFEYLYDLSSNSKSFHWNISYLYTHYSLWCFHILRYLWNFATHDCLLNSLLRCQFKICRISRAIYLHYVTLMPMAMALTIFCSRH